MDRPDRRSRRTGDAHQLLVNVSDIADAVAVLRAGGLVAFPTETVYGLGADAANLDALHRLYAVKGRPHDHPVIVHVARAEQLDELAEDIPDIARTLAQACWPGPLTLVVRKRPDRVADAATGNLSTVGIRVPDHPVALALLDAFGGGVAAPSANRFGKVSPTTAAHVRADLGADVDRVLDGGPARVGVESTIVDVTGPEPVVLRLGGVSEAQLAALAGRPLLRRTSGEVAAPGTLPSHYAPNARVVVVARGAEDVTVASLRDSGLRVAVIAAPPATDEYARNLYTLLRDADARGVDVIVAPEPSNTYGIGAAIADRLRRASSM
jgi:L-threonylcarbamoyladenylate synthase